MNKYPNLFQPLTIRNVTFRNRIFSSPCAMTPGGHSHTPDPMAMLYFENKARGGAGAVTVSETCVNLKYATRKLNVGNVAVLAPEQSNHREWIKVASMISRHGAVPSVQLFHAGAASHPRFLEGRDPIGPDDYVREDGVHVRGMDEALMQETIDDFVKAALQMKRCGFKMIMIHGGHGWLFSQFLSPATNHRTDEYGGSLENRARFPLRVYKAIREAVGENFVIELRMSGDEHMENGITLEDVCKYAQLAEEYVDIIHVSAGSYYTTNQYTFPGIFVPHGCNLEPAKAVKKAVKKAKVATVGGYYDPAEMDRIIRDGDADIVYMARQLLADPETPNKWRAGREEDVVPCVRCLNCIGRFDVGEFGCDVNPSVGHELLNMNLYPAPEHKRKVVVVGGGPAGLSAALTAKRRGHDVTLLEKEGRLGGTLNCLEHDCHKKDMMRFRDFLIRKVYDDGVEVRLNTEVTRQMLEEMKPDYVLCAVGSDPLIPRIPGLAEFALTPHQLIDKAGSEGQNIVIIGGGLSGCEMGLSYAEEGKHVTIIEMQKKLAAQANHIHGPAIQETLQRLADCMTLMTETTCVSVSEGRVEVLDKDRQPLTVYGDTIINALGLRPRRNLVEELRKADVPFFEPIGDCYDLTQVRGAVHNGYYRAMDIR